MPLDPATVLSPSLHVPTQDDKAEALRVLYAAGQRWCGVEGIDNALSDLMSGDYSAFPYLGRNPRSFDYCFYQQDDIDQDDLIAVGTRANSVAHMVEYLARFGITATTFLGWDDRIESMVIEDEQPDIPHTIEIDINPDPL